MPDKDPSNLSLLAYLWVIGLSLLGGSVNFANRVTKGHTTWRNFAGLAAELMTAVFVGVITYWLCEWRELPPLLTAALTGVSAHMGTRALFQLEVIRDRLLGTPKE